MLARASGWTIPCGLPLAGSAALAQASAKQPNYETAFYPSGKLKIEAYVFKPEGTGPFEVVICNHGSRPGHEREVSAFGPQDAAGVATGHMIFEREGWKIWEPDVKEFLAKYLVELQKRRGDAAPVQRKQLITERGRGVS